MIKLFFFFFLQILDDDFLFFEEKKVEEFSFSSTGNAELDSMISGLNSFGIAPELAEMMQAASSMQPEQDDFQTSGGVG